MVAFQKAKPMFDPTQQDVISALVNLGIPMKRAEKMLTKFHRPSVTKASIHC